jgi:hypothetical protein
VLVLGRYLQIDAGDFAVFQIDGNFNRGEPLGSKFGSAPSELLPNARD